MAIKSAYYADAERNYNKLKAAQFDKLFDHIIDLGMETYSAEDWFAKYMIISKKTMSRYPHLFATAFAPSNEKQKSENFIKEAIRQDQVRKIQLTAEQMKRAEDVKFVGKEPPRKKGEKNIEEQDWSSIFKFGKE